MSCVTYLGCGGAAAPQPVAGPPITGNIRPRFEFVTPTASFSVGQGGSFEIEWTDQDQDSAAAISFSLVSTDPTASPSSVLLVEGVPENDLEAADSVLVSTGFVPQGTYFLRAVIDDDVNLPVETFATVPSPGTSLIVVTIGEAGATPGNSPPSVVVTQPLFNLAVTLDDTIDIQIQPTADAPDATRPYDADDDSRLFLSLDLDDDPLTGDPANPDPGELIALLPTPRNIPEDDFGQIPFTISVDLERFPLRADGKPYFIRATIDDGNNPPRDAYATGTINVTRTAGGKVDLGQVGGTILGARLLGFDPGARLGTAMAGVPDFDADGVEDCLVVAEFGVPTGRVPTGEAYLIYGLNNLRFGGRFNVNTVGTNIDGATFMGPEPFLSDETSGINAVGFVPDLSGDGRPELLFGCEFVDGLRQHRDDDPGDASETDDETVTVRIRQGEVTVSRPDPITGGDRVEFTDLSYRGVEDTMIDRNSPTTSFGSSVSLEWSAELVNATLTGIRYPLLKFDDIRSVVPDFFSSGIPLCANTCASAFNNECDDGGAGAVSAECVFGTDCADCGPRGGVDFEIQSATISFEVTDLGGSGELHGLLPPGDFSGGTTFSDFGEPTADVQFDDTSFQVPGFTGRRVVDVAETVTEFLDGERGILGWIILPMATGMTFDESQISSSEAGDADRPMLEIVYTRPRGSGFGLLNCYPDLFANNASDNPAACSGEDDILCSSPDKFERLGTVAMVNSENRDDDLPPTLSADEFDLHTRRLRRASVELDLAGQQRIGDGGGTFFPGADADLATSGTARLEGARFQSCMFDLIDASGLNQPPIRDRFGARVGFIPDLNNDQQPEIIMSAPRNELDVKELTALYPDISPLLITHLTSRPLKCNILVYFGANYNVLTERQDRGNSTFPQFDPTVRPGSCTDPITARVVEPFFGLPGQTVAGEEPGSARFDNLGIFGEKPEDMLGDGSSAGDFNLDGSPDILCGAPFADPPSGADAGTTYIVYGRQANQDRFVNLADANVASQRPPMLRIRGDRPNDRIGLVQESIRDINGDRINDIAIGSPLVDAGGVSPSASCSADFNGDGSVNSADAATLNSCTAQFSAQDLSSENRCAFFDYDHDRDVDEDDVNVFACLRDTASASCCPVDNGIVAVVFGGITLDGDRRVSQIATTDLPGVVFYGTNAGDRAGYDIASAGDFNRDGFGDLLISAPGARRTDADNRTRVGVVYLIFGGPNLANQRFSLDDVGSADLPGIVFLSPYTNTEPDEAPPQFVASLGDLDNDGFDDIGIGNPLADFVDELLPQQPGTPGDDMSTGRRRNAGEIYLIYGNNIGG